MKLTFPLKIINVFCNNELGLLGNPCAVIFLKEYLDDKVLQNIAKQLDQPATAFISESENSDTYSIRWFAPDAEIDLCGHGAAAAIKFILSAGISTKNKITLKSNSGTIINGSNKDGHIIFSMPEINSSGKIDPPANLETALGKKITSYHKTGNKNIVVLEDEDSVRTMDPDFKLLRTIDVFGYAVTARSSHKNYDFVSRTLVPHVQQLEDYATGSSHSILFPYWKSILNKTKLTSVQLSRRGGYFQAELKDNKVHFLIQAEEMLDGTLNMAI